GYWADHLDSAIADVVRGGDRRARLHLAEGPVLGSAGGRGVVEEYKQLPGVGRRVPVPKPTGPRPTALRPPEPPAPPRHGPNDVTLRPTKAGRFLERAGATFHIVDLDSAATLTCRAVGSEEPLVSGGFHEEHCQSLGSQAPLLAVGVGAFGVSFADCRSRFG